MEDATRTEILGWLPNDVQLDSDPLRKGLTRPLPSMGKQEAPKQVDTAKDVYLARPFYLDRRPTGNVTPYAVSVARHGRICSRTAILSSAQALLALDPSANRKSLNHPNIFALIRE